MNNLNSSFMFKQENHYNNLKNNKKRNFPTFWVGGGGGGGSPQKVGKFHILHGAVVKKGFNIAAFPDSLQQPKK